MSNVVHVEVSGLTGSGKSAVMGEIEIALKALGLKVEHGPDFQAEKNATHADWQQALDLYQPTVVLTERNISRAPEAREGEGEAWKFRNMDLRQVGVTMDKREADRKAEAGWEIEPLGLITHPAAPSADKLRIAVEALEGARDPLSTAKMWGKRKGGCDGAVDKIDRALWGIKQALAALKAEG